MPIGFGLASSHAPSIDAPLDKWGTIYNRLTKGIPQPLEALRENEEVIGGYIGRINNAFDALQKQLAGYDPELLIIVGGDQTEMFDSSNVPNLMIYLGDFAWGQNNNGLAGEQPSEETLIRLKVDSDASRRLLEKLVKLEGFDVSFSEEQTGLGRPERGLPHAFIRPAPHLMPELNVPTILLYENTYDPPSLPADRCYELGRTLVRLLKDDPRRIAIYGSGGLSHDPGGPRSGWIDEELDRWFLDRLAEGDGRATTALYSFDSLTMHGGTGEMRAWITVAGAMDELGPRSAQIVDYVPAHQSVTGLGWAYWPES